MYLLLDTICIIALTFFIYKAWNNGVPIILIWLFCSFIWDLIIWYRRNRKKSE